MLFRLCGRPPISSQGRPNASHMVKGVFKGGTLCHVKGATLGHRWHPYAPKAPTVHDELHIFAKSVYMRVEAYLRGNILCFRYCVFRYCVSVYGNGSAANGARLLKVINFATRVVTGLRRYDHVSRARCDLGLLTPREMSDIRTVIVAHRACVEGLPADLASMLSTNACRAVE